MITFVRVEDEHGNKFSISDQSPDLDLYTVIDEPAVDRSGDALPPYVAREHDEPWFEGNQVEGAVPPDAEQTPDDPPAGDPPSHTFTGGFGEHLASQEAPTGQPATDTEENS